MIYRRLEEAYLRRTWGGEGSSTESAESHSGRSHDSESTTGIPALSILYLCRVVLCSVSLLHVIVTFSLKVSLRSSMSRIN